MFQPVAVSEFLPVTQPANLPPDWESHVYQLERQAAVEAGFSVGGVKFTDNYRLLVMDTVRLRTVRRGRRTQRWGCGYRLVIEVSDTDLTSKLSLPVLAASAEISNLEVSVMLEVKGYRGNEVWSVIPAPEPLGVDSYKRYLEAVVNIQAMFAEHEDRCVEVLLAEDDAESDLLVGGIDDNDVRGAIGVLAGLRAIADGQLLAEALEGDGQEFTSEITAVYRFLRGERADSAEPVSDAERASARSRLPA